MPSSFITAARAGDRRALARLITLVEKGRPEGRETLSALFGDTGRAHVIGITGAPGSGKSTLTDRLIGAIRSEGSEVAVVAVDPSSPFTGGAILGDRIRMQDHVSDPGVFIRSMGSRGHLGGLSAATTKAVAVLDGIGFPFVIVETVGVGQAEVEIAEAADTTLVVVTPGWGDSVQANKAGLLEIADVFVVNKADRKGTNDAVRDLTQMLELGATAAWTPPILTTVATESEGIAEVWEAIGRHREHLVSTGELDSARKKRLETQLVHALAAELAGRAADPNPRFKGGLARVTSRVADPWSVASELAG